MEPVTIIPEQDAMARKGLEYAETITALAKQLELPPEFVLMIFGAFARKLIGGDLDNDQRVQWAVSSFMGGMGFNVNKIGKVPPPQQH